MYVFLFSKGNIHFSLHNAHMFIRIYLLYALNVNIVYTCNRNLFKQLMPMNGEVVFGSDVVLGFTEQPDHSATCTSYSSSKWDVRKNLHSRFASLNQFKV